MFTPEFISREAGTFVLVASHSVETPEALQWSVAFNKARIAYGMSEVPDWLHTCRVVYDIRGQRVPDASVAELQDALSGVCNLELMR